MGITTFVGIDVAKDKLDVAAVSTDDASQNINGTFSQTAQGHRQLIEQLPKPRTCLVIALATGGYERAVIAELVGVA